MSRFWITAIATSLTALGLGLASEAIATEPSLESELIVNVNTASQAMLETIPGIGAKIARRIIAGRPYKRVEDLLRVQGIGKKTLEKLRPYVRIEGKTEER